MATYHITTPQQLQDINNDLAGDYILDNDLDMSGYGDIIFTENDSPTSGYSAYFNGRTSFLKVGASSDFEFLDNDLTIDFRIKMPNSAESIQILAQDAGSRFVSVDGNFNDGFVIKFFSTFEGPQTSLNATYYGSSGITRIMLAPDTWYHIAIVRYGSSMLLFVNGIQQTFELIAPYDAVGSYPLATLGDILLCNNGNIVTYIGKLSEFRISKGIARWTEEFTPPTEDYTPDEYTSLLLHFNNDVSDSSPNTKQVIKYSGWQPIGWDYPYFAGTFDGQGFTIRNLTYDDSINNYNAAIFAAAQSDLTLVTLKNLKLENFILTSDSDAGALIGYSSGVAISDISAKNITIISTSGGQGGIVGELEEGMFPTELIRCSIENLTFNATASEWWSTELIGGLFGHAYGATISECSASNINIGVLTYSSNGQIGVLGGSADTCTITRCNTRDGYINAVSSQPRNEGGGVSELAGLVGSLYFSTVSNCHAYGIKINGEMINTVGGLAGMIMECNISKCSAQYIELSLCWRNIGGFIGTMGVEEEEPSIVTDCHTKHIHIEGYEYQDGYAPEVFGGFIGEMVFGTVQRCYAVQSLINYVYHNAGGFAGKIDNSSQVLDCYSTTIIDSDLPYHDLGVGNSGGFTGFVGWDVQLTNCYSTGSVTFHGSSDIDNVGGFIGGIWPTYQGGGIG